jgi:hypothetical protein
MILTHTWAQPLYTSLPLFFSFFIQLLASALCHGTRGPDINLGGFSQALASHPVGLSRYRTLAPKLRRSNPYDAKGGSTINRRVEPVLEL